MSKMSQYKCVPAPSNLSIGKNGDHSAAIKSFADLINKEAAGGWDFVSMGSISVTEPNGCLTSFFGVPKIRLHILIC